MDFELMSKIVKDMCKSNIDNAAYNFLITILLSNFVWYFLFYCLFSSFHSNLMLLQIYEGIHEIRRIKKKVASTEMIRPLQHDSMSDFDN